MSGIFLLVVQNPKTDVTAIIGTFKFYPLYNLVSTCQGTLEITDVARLEALVSNVGDD